MKLSEKLKLPYYLEAIVNSPNVTNAVVPPVIQAAVAVPAEGDRPLVMPTLLYPSKLKLAFAAAPGSGTLTIEGYIKIGPAATNVRSRREFITLGTETDYETANYYIWSTAYPLTVTASSVGTAGNAVPTWDSELYESEVII